MTAEDPEDTGLLAVELNSHNAPRFSQDPSRTVLVLGSRAAATGWITWILQELGVFMGWSFTPSLEDWSFCVPVFCSRSRAVSGTRRLIIEHLEETVLHRNRAHTTWGFNAGLDFEKLRVLQRLLRNPYFVVPTKALPDVSLGPEEIAGTLQGKLIERARAQLDACSFLQDRGYPGMVFDVASATSHPETFLSRLVQRLGLEVKANALDGAVSALAQSGLRLPSRRLRGFVDEVGETGVRGWACDENQPREPLRLKLLVDGQQVATAAAELPRSDVRAAGHHPTGRCGFEFRLSESTLRVGQELRVVDAYEGRDLDKSGILYRPGLLKLIRPHASCSGLPVGEKLEEQGSTWGRGFRRRR